MTSQDAAVKLVVQQGDANDERKIYLSVRMRVHVSVKKKYMKTDLLMIIQIVRRMTSKIVVYYIGSFLTCLWTTIQSNFQ